MNSKSFQAAGAQTCHCRAIAYPASSTTPVFRQIADQLGAYLIVDMAHMPTDRAGLHPSPVPYAVSYDDHHTTLRVPRGGMVGPSGARQTSKPCFSRMQGGPLMLYRRQSGGAGGGKNVESGCKSLPAADRKELQTLRKLVSQGFRRPRTAPIPIGGGARRLRKSELTGKVAQEILDSRVSRSNKNGCRSTLCRPSSPVAVRIGTPAVTPEAEERR